MHIIRDDLENQLHLVFTRGGKPNFSNHYSLPSINVNPREWIKVNIYRGVNS